MNPENYFTLRNGKQVYCDKPTKVNAKGVMDSFDEPYSRLIGGKSMWAIDIGTSCGDSTIVMAANLSPGSTIICFEPSLEIYPLLKDNLGQNNHLGVHFDIHQVAAGDMFGVMDFDYVLDNGGLALPGIVHPRIKPPYKVRVVQTYDYLLTHYSAEQLSQVKFLKIDTEGYDYAVLRGVSPLILQNKMPIICEWWNDPFNSIELFNSIEYIGYIPYNTKGERVSPSDFSTDKRTNDLCLMPK